MNGCKRVRRCKDVSFLPKCRKPNRSKASQKPQLEPPIRKPDIINDGFNELTMINALYPPTEASPRVMFISFVYMAKHWHTIPLQILHDSIFFFPSVKRSWIFPADMSHWIQAQNTFLSKISLPQLFLQLLIKKEEQNLIIYMPEDNELNGLKSCDGKQDKSKHKRKQRNTYDMMGDVKVHDQYRVFSHRLSQITDPMTNKGYNPLQTNPRWWWTLPATQLKYTRDIQSIIVELCYAKMKFRPLLDIIRLSNPTLLPLAQWMGNEQYEQSVQHILHDQSNTNLLDPTLVSANSNSTLADIQSDVTIPVISSHLSVDMPQKCELTMSASATSVMDEKRVNNGFAYIEEFTDRESGFTFLIYDDDSDNDDSHSY